MKGLVVMTNKKTKRTVLNEMLGNEIFMANPDWVAYAEHELELLDRKAESKGMTKVQVANEELKDVILDKMTIDSLYTATQIVKIVGDDRVQSTQKVVALMKSLVESGKVVRVEDKKSTYFKKVGV